MERAGRRLAAKEFGIAAQVISLSDDEINTIKEVQLKQDIRGTDECDEEPDVLGVD